MSQYDFDITGSTTGVGLVDAFNKSFAAVHSGHSGPTRPSYATRGMIWTKQGTTDQLVYYDGTNDIVLCNLNQSLASQFGMPIGSIVMWSGAVANIPKGWRLCDGGGGTPDLRDRFVVGAGRAYQPNARGGADRVTLSAKELPSHTHGSGSMATASAGAHTHSGSTNTAGKHGHDVIRESFYQGTVGKFFAFVPWKNNFPNTVNKEPIPDAGDHAHALNVNSAGAHTHGISGATAATGGGQSHENRPPYHALCYIMKVN